MLTHVALLRGINVGGHNKVAMSDLRDLFETLGFAGAQSLLQSGNLVFAGKKRATGTLERLLEAETTKRLGVSVQYIVRTSAELAAILAANPFPSEAENDPAHLLVMFLKDAPQPGTVEALRAAIPGRERLRADGKQLYLVYPDGVGTSKLTNALIEKTLGVRGTARNWNTVLKIAGLMRG